MLTSTLTQRTNVLRDLFDLLDAPFSDTDHKANAATASALWMSNHGTLNVDYSNEALRRVYEFFGPQLGMVGESLPELNGVPARKCRTNNPGATVRAALKRIKLYRRLLELGHCPGDLLCWAGQRLRELPKGETVPELVALIERENPAIADHPWVVDQLAKNDEANNRFDRPFATETEITILCALLVFGSDLRITEHAVPKREHHRLLRGPDGYPFLVPGRTVEYYTLERDDLLITVYNGEAVERRNGKGEWLEPRPTTASTAAAVAKLWGYDGLQGLMVSNPHAYRLAIEIDGVVRALGYEPSFVVYALPGADVTTDAALLTAAKTILGEVARTLTEEYNLGLV